MDRYRRTKGRAALDAITVARNDGKISMLGYARKEDARTGKVTENDYGNETRRRVGAREPPANNVQSKRFREERETGRRESDTGAENGKLEPDRTPTSWRAGDWLKTQAREKKKKEKKRDKRHLCRLAKRIPNVSGRAPAFDVRETCILSPRAISNEIYSAEYGKETQRRKRA